MHVNDHVKGMTQQMYMLLNERIKERMSEYELMTK